MTSGAIFAASAGPMPFTRSSACSEPNGPCASRSATMRPASAGPMPGSRSSSAALATSTSTVKSTRTSTLPSTLPSPLTGSRNATFGAAAGVGGRPRRDAVGRRLPPEATAESTAAICTASAVRSVADAAGSRARQPRTPTPSAATAATKRRACRSAGVGTTADYLAGARGEPPKPRRRCRSNADRAVIKSRQVIAQLVLCLYAAFIVCV